MKRLPNRLKVKAANDPQPKKSYRMSNLDEQVELTEKEIKAIDEKIQKLKEEWRRTHPCQQH